MNLILSLSPVLAMSGVWIGGGSVSIILVIIIIVVLVLRR